MKNKKETLNEFYRLSGEKLNEGTRQDAIEAVNMLVSHLYHADQSIDNNKAFEILSKNPSLVNSLPLSPEDVESLKHLSTVVRDNESNEKLQRILKIVKSYV